MYNKKILRKQLEQHFEELQDLILRYAQGEMDVKQRRDQLEGVVQIKMAIYLGLGKDENLCD